jgi:phage host-nuclease inhibitor protein Gam
MVNRRGYVFKSETNGKWYARPTFVDNTGKRREIKKTAETRGEASRLPDQMRDKIEATAPAEAPELERITFNDLANAYGSKP